MAHNAPAFLTRHSRVSADIDFARAEVADPSQTLDPLPDELPLTPTLQGAELLQAYASATLQAVSAALVTPMALVGGSAGADSLTGTTSDDLLQGLGGNDTIDGAGGNDTVYGGESGNDIGSGDDSITTGSGNDVIYGQDGNDSILAGEGDDFIDAGDGNDTVWGHLGTDSIYGGDGNDALSAFGPGVENLPGSGSQDGGGGLIDGGAGDDAIAAIEVDGYNVPYESPVVYSHVAIGGDGNDRIDVGGYDRLVYGDLQDPQAVVSSGNDFIRSYTVGVLGGPGGSVPRSAIYAGPGNDTIECSNADFSTIDGGGGDDLITSLWDGQSTLIGGAGADSLSATFSNGDFGNPFESRGLEKTRLDGGSGNDNLRVDSNVDTNGGQTEITLLGGDDADSLTAQDSEADNNASRGMAHVTLDGGNGNDVLTVSGGLDVWLTGGAGRDTFVVTQAQYLTQTLGARLFENLGGTQTSVAAGPLQITDFQSGMGGDVLDLSSVLAGSAVGYVSGSNPFESGHLSAQQVGADTHIVFDPDGLSAGAANPMTLAVLQGVSTGGLTAANFLPSQYTNTNDAPLASNDSGSGAEDGGALTGNVLTNDSDPDGDTLSVTGYSIAGMSGSFTAGQTATLIGVGGLVIHSGGDYTFSPAAGYSGNVPLVTYTVSDGSLTSSATLALTISAANQPPTLVQPMPDQQAAQDWAFNAALPAGMFTDADSAGLTLSASLAGGAALPAWLTFNATTRSFSGTPTVAYASATRAPTPLDIVVTATDTEGATTTDAFVLTVNWSRSIAGTAGNDALTGSLANETLSGAGGNDTLVSNGGNDFLEGGSGNDSVVGGVGNDTLNGNAGRDTLLGGAGDDVLNGGVNRDLMDSMVGGAGNDSYFVDAALDRVVELAGEGQDTVTSSLFFYTLPAAVEVLVLTGSAKTGFGNAIANSITGNAGANYLHGQEGNDSLAGMAGNDYMYGGPGNDTLNGGTGNDTLNGSSGNDVLNGGAGNELLFGNAGADLFIFDLAPNLTTNLDRISDFNGTPDPVTGEQDHIWLDDAVFTAFTGLSSITASALRSGAGMTTAISVDHRLIYNTTTGALYYDPDGVGGTAATQFALLTNRAVLDNTDFQVG